MWRQPPPSPSTTCAGGSGREVEAALNCFAHAAPGRLGGCERTRDDVANTAAARGIRLTKALRRVAVSTQRRRWSRAAAGWDHHGVTGLSNIIAAVLDEAHPAPGMVAVDLGAGTGALTLPLAGRVESV